MNKEEFDFMEVKAKDAGWYFVTMYQYKKGDEKWPDYIIDWIEFDGENWVYDGYSGCCYVCFVHQKDNGGNNV